MPEQVVPAAGSGGLIHFCNSCGQPLERLPISEVGSESSPTVDHSLATARPSAPKPFPTGTVLAERYRIVALLGSGGAAEVYRADDLTLDQPVSLKFFSSPLQGEEQARFHREVRLGRQVSHPNICRVFDLGESDGRAFITMEFVSGEDLHSLLRRIGRLPRDKALDVARQLCAGLAAAHEAGVLHLDLKPANVMLDAGGRVRITDFGLASAAGEAGCDLISGTPGYMSPEQLAGKEATVQSDIYSLGLVLYEIFTGRRAFASGTSQKRQRYDAPRLNMKEVAEPVRHCILRCLHPQPNLRPPTALHVAAELTRDGALDKVEETEHSRNTIEKPYKPSRQRLAWTLVAATMLGCALMLILALRSSGFSPRGQAANSSVAVAFTWLWCLSLQSFLAMLAMAYLLHSSRRIKPPSQIRTL